MQNSYRHFRSCIWSRSHWGIGLFYWSNIRILIGSVETPKGDNAAGFLSICCFKFVI